MFKPDQPITSHKEDILNRHLFSQSLGKAILSYKDKNSVVIGLFGAWGSGKTSIVNMSLEYVDNVSNNLPATERPVVLRFNPWNFSDQNQLISQFFKQLSSILKHRDLGKEVENIGKQIENYAEFFEPLALIPVFGITTAVVGKVIGRVGARLGQWGKNQQSDLNVAKEKLNTQVEKLSRKIIIVIDDIDRLNTIEIRQVFQLVKSLCDFPNTIYLLPFDKQVVIKALAEVQANSGNEYLEKVVQIPFEIPVIQRHSLEKLLFSQLDLLIKDLPEEKWDQTYWGNIYHSGLNYFFETIRDVNRYINSLRFSFGMIKEEVNPIDFLAITGIQVFLPEIYYGIRDNKDLFAGASGSETQAQKEQSKKRCDEIIERAGEFPKERLLNFLKRLFPPVESIYGNIGYGEGSLDNWRIRCRVCSPDKFDIYFQLALPEGEIGQKEIETLLSLTNNLEAFRSALLKLNEDGRAIKFLERLEDYTETYIAKENIQNVISALMDIGDLFPDTDTGFFGFDTPMRVLRIFYQLGNRFDTQSERFEIFKQSMEQATQSLYPIVNEVSIQDQKHNKNKAKKEQDLNEKLTINEEQLKELKLIACGKIETWAKDGRLRKHNRLAYILFCWKNWNDKDDYKTFVDNLIKDDEGLLVFVVSFLSKSFSYGMSDYVGRINWRMDLKWMGQFVDPKTIEPRLRSKLSSDAFNKLLEKQQLAIRTFLDTFDEKVKDFHN